MKAKIILGLIMILALAVLSSYAQELTLTTTNANTVSSKSSIDLPGLTGNPLAIIVATPVGDTAALNPHPVGAWYYSGKWNIFNTDHAVMPIGSKYKVQFFLEPGPNQFLHLITQQNLGNEGSYIDNPALNNNPNAQLVILQNHAPDNRAGYYLNRFEAKTAYSSTTGKWYIANINGQPLNRNTAYNVVITSGGTVGSDTTASPRILSPSVASVTTKTPAIPATNQPSPIAPSISASRQPTKTQPPKSIQLAFDNLNDFVAKGLPASAALPTENLDLAAVIMARQISVFGEQSLPVLLAALQTAGFTIIDEKRKILLRPIGKGQGLGFYNFEAVGALKLANRGVTVSLDKLAATITKETPQISASQFAGMMLRELREQAENSQNANLRFWARLIIELGNASGQSNDLATASPGDVRLTMLQATLLLRRVQGDFYALRTKRTGRYQPGFFLQNSFMRAAWSDGPIQPVSRRELDGPCNLTGDQALIMDAAAVPLTTWNGWQVGQFAESATLSRITNTLAVVNIVLAWGKLVAAVTTMKGEIIVQQPLPLIRTKNSTPGEKRLLKARVWSEVGDVEALNCLRPTLNLLTGLDFNLPSDGPIADVAAEWHFAGDNEINVNNPETRNLQSFVAFESPQGKNENPQKQVTDENGVSQMWLVGTPKIPAVVYQKDPMKVEKEAKVLIGITLKSAKDFVQNWIDIGGTAVGLATGGPLGLLGTAAEIGYRVPWVAARATIPVTDHEPCDGQWVGTVTYIVISTSKHTTTFPARIPPNSGGTGYFGGSSSIDQTVTLSGTITVNSKYGHDSLTSASADEILIMTTNHSGAGYCGKKAGVRQYSSGGTQTTTASGNTQATSTVYIYLDKDYYTISVKPLNVNATLQTTHESSFSGGCPGQKAAPSTSHSSTTEYVGEDITGKAPYGRDQNTLSGSDSHTDSSGTVRTITWNLRRCN